MELDREILELEAKLAEVPKWEARVNELERLLGAVEGVEEKEKEV